MPVKKKESRVATDAYCLGSAELEPLVGRGIIEVTAERYDLTLKLSGGLSLTVSNQPGGLQLSVFKTPPPPVLVTEKKNREPINATSKRYDFNKQMRRTR